ncbi:unnamed protein product [Caenorhabditis angaria]|uniref:Uncharacterized protein n=1 Tax=Caenorhabditis angaria TaxID=860376 RepID=A0A9P1NBC8_9PELO|nr:unnamed protein product [Caenorhabditis angaria]
MTYSTKIRNIVDDAEDYVSPVRNNHVPRIDPAFIQLCSEILDSFSAILARLSETANRGNNFLHEMIAEVDNDIRNARTFLLNEGNADYVTSLIRLLHTIRSKYYRLAKFHAYFFILEHISRSI